MKNVNKMMALGFDMYGVPPIRTTCRYQKCANTWCCRNIHGFFLLLFFFSPIYSVARPQKTWTGRWCDAIVRDRRQSPAADDATWPRKFNQAILFYMRARISHRLPGDYVMRCWCGTALPRPPAGGLCDILLHVIASESNVVCVWRALWFDIDFSNAAAASTGPGPVFKC